MSEKMKHTPEMWSPKGDCGIAHEGNYIGSMVTQQRNRAIACHNALSGIENPEEFRKRFDEMVDILEESTALLQFGGSIQTKEYVVNRGLAAMKVVASTEEGWEG